MKGKIHGQTLFTVSSVLCLWAFLFIFVLIIHAEWLYPLAVGLAFGQVFFLLLNIPLGIVSLVRIIIKRVDKTLRLPLAVVSVMNTLVGIADWTFVIMFLQKP